MNWTLAMETHVDSMFFWGYLISQIPGGFIANQYPANKVFGLSIVSSSCLNLLWPVVLTILNGRMAICLRLLQGLVEVSRSYDRYSVQFAGLISNLIFIWTVF